VPTVTVPEVRWVERTDQYCVKVLVPVIEGWLLRVSVQKVYEPPSAEIVPRVGWPEQGSGTRVSVVWLGYLMNGIRTVGAVRLDNVVLGLRRVHPAVHGEVRARASSAVGGGVLDVAGRTSGPTKPNDEISVSGPLGCVGAS